MVLSTWKTSPARGRRPAGHEAQLGTVLDELETSPAVLVAHDAAGPDAIRYTLGNPQRAARLVLLDSHFGHQPALRFPEMIKPLAYPALRPLADAMIGDET